MSPWDYDNTDTSNYRWAGSGYYTVIMPTANHYWYANSLVSVAGDEPIKDSASKEWDD
jgi:hypothetical protein